MASNDTDKPRKMDLACAGIGTIFFAVSLILHGYAAFSPYFDYEDSYDDSWGKETKYRNHHDKRDAIAIPATILEAIFSLWAITFSTSRFPERTALSLLCAFLALGISVLSIVTSGVRSWAAATWLLFGIFWLAFAFEYCLGPLGWLENWVHSDGPRRLISWARQAMRMVPPHDPRVPEHGDSYTFTAIPTSPSQNGSPTVVGSPRPSSGSV